MLVLVSYNSIGFDIQPKIDNLLTIIAGLTACPNFVFWASRLILIILDEGELKN